MATFKDAWGFSKLDTYRSCPQKFYYQFIQKLPQPSSPALERGSKIHEEAEAFLRGWITTLSDPLLNWQDQFDGLRELKCKCEAAWGFNKKWELLPNWMHPDTWLRAKSDAHYVKDGVLYIIDFKTGKYRVPSTEQIEIYAICGSAVYPEIEKIVAQFWFIDTGHTYDREYTKEHLVELRKKYEDYIKPIFADETWKPAPSRECRWCFASNSQEGPCEF